MLETMPVEELKAFLGSSTFDAVLRHVDSDDSVATILENERQHGRGRVGYGSKLKTITTALVKSFLAEFVTEHRSRGLGIAASELREPQERIRGVVKFSAAVKAAEALSKKRPGAGSVRNLFCTTQDSNDRRNLALAGNTRTREQFLDNKHRWGASCFRINWLAAWSP